MNKLAKWLLAADKEGNEEIMGGSESKTISEHIGRLQYYNAPQTMFCSLAVLIVEGLLGLAIPGLRNHYIKTFYAHNPNKVPHV